MNNNSLRRSLCAAMVAFFVLTANTTLVPGVMAAAPNPQPKQDVSIEVVESGSIQFSSHYMSVQNLNGNTLNASIFGRAYQVDISRADLTDSSGNPISRTALSSAGKVNVFGSVSASVSLSVSARLVQIVSSGGGTTNPTGCTIRVISNTPTNWLIGGPIADGQFVKSPSYPTLTPTATHTRDTSGNPLTAGIYGIQLPQTANGWTNPVVTPAASQMCQNGSSITFTIAYADPNGSGVVPPTSTSTGSTGGGTDSVGRLMNALYQHTLTGENMSGVHDVQEELWGEPISTWNDSGGSQNLALVAEAATGDYRFFKDLSDFSKSSRGGIFNRELGSPGFYFAGPIAALVVALRDARRANDQEAIASISGYLRATWALWSLVTVPANRTSGWLNLNGTIQTGTSSGGSFRKTPTTAVAGERWLTEYGQLQTELWRDEVSYFLSWALDIPRSEGNNFSGLPLSGNQNAYADNIVAASIGVNNSRQTTPAEAWGLSDSDRAMFASIINGNRSRLGDVLNIVSEYGVYGHLIRMRRTSNGVETIFFRSLNGNKPTHAATIVTNNGEWKGIRPCYYNSNSNPGYYVEVANGTITAGGDSSNCKTVSMPELDGSLIYSVVLNGKQAVEGSVSGSGTALPPNPNPNPNPDPGNSTTTPSQSDRAHNLIDEIKNLRKDTKAFGFSRNPIDKPKILINLVKMQTKIIELAVEVRPYMDNFDTASAMSQVQPRFTAFNAIGIFCASPAAYVPFVRVSDSCTTGLEQTGGRLNQSLDSLKNSLPAPSSGTNTNGGNGGDGGGGDNNGDNTNPQGPNNISPN